MKKKNSAQILLRLPKEDKEAFLDLCDDLDTSAAREVRRFIRQFISQNAKGDGQ